MSVTYVRTQHQALERKLTEVINKSISEFENDTDMTIDSISINFETFIRKDGMKGTEVDRIVASVAIWKPNFLAKWIRGTHMRNVITYVQSN